MRLREILRHLRGQQRPQARAHGCRNSVQIGIGMHVCTHFAFRQCFDSVTTVEYFEDLLDVRPMNYFYTIVDSDGETDNAAVTVTVNALPATQTYVQDEVPDLAIPDRGTVTSTLNVGDSFTIASLSISVDITHQRRSDLRLYLIHGGRRIQLPDASGGALTGFNGDDVFGDWILEVQDKKRRRVGTLNDWQLTIERA